MSCPPEDNVAPQALKTDTPVCIVLGGEREGVSPRVLSLANQCIEIPSDGLGGSINLATAAAIVMYEVARRFALT